MLEHCSVGYVAIHKESKQFFIGKATQIAYTKINFLKSAMTYKGRNKSEYDFYAITNNGTFMKLDGVDK